MFGHYALTYQQGLHFSLFLSRQFRHFILHRPECKKCYRILPRHFHSALFHRAFLLVFLHLKKSVAIIDKLYCNCSPSICTITGNILATLIKIKVDKKITCTSAGNMLVTLMKIITGMEAKALDPAMMESVQRTKLKSLQNKNKIGFKDECSNPSLSHAAT